MTTATAIKMDLGNNETVSRGIVRDPSGYYTATTFTQSKDFKTLAGAQKWLAKNTAR